MRTVMQCPGLSAGNKSYFDCVETSLNFSALCHGEEQSDVAIHDNQLVTLIYMWIAASAGGELAMTKKTIPV